MIAGDIELRMYCLVMYNLSPIQQGIQASHAIVERSMVGIPTTQPTWPNYSYKEWAEHWKTIIVLNGGTSCGEDQISKIKAPHVPRIGTMEMHKKSLEMMKIPFGAFYEPDLNFALSALAFVLPATIFNYEKNNTNPIFAPIVQAGNWIQQFKLA